MPRPLRSTLRRVLAALLTALALVPAAASAGQPPGQATDAWRAFEPKGREFRLALPPGWTLADGAQKAGGEDFEIVLTRPGQSPLGYRRIAVRAVASPHRTAERLLFDLRNPAYAPPRLQAMAGAAESRAQALPAGQAQVFERRSERGIHGYTEVVPARVRTLVLPRARGFFTLTLDAPEADFEAALEDFERLAREFTPGREPEPRGPELSGDEREAWAAFFAAPEKPRAKAPESPPPSPPPAQGTAREQLEALALARRGGPPEPPEPPDEAQHLLSDARKARLVSGRTLAAPALLAAELERMARRCDGKIPAAELVAAWEAVRGQRVLVTDAILAPGLEVEPERAGKHRPQAEPELMGGPGTQGRMGRLSPTVGGGRPFFSGEATLSRLAFSPDRGLALGYVAVTGVSPGTRHFVLFRREGGAWTVCGAALDGMIIY